MGKLYDKFRQYGKGLGDWWHWSAIANEDIFRYFLEKAKPKIALEIGTHYGVSTALIAEYAEEVHTFDIFAFPIQEKIWDFCGCKHKIKVYNCKSSKLKKQIVESIPFDFAFIDGSHMFENVAFDFALVRRCGNILFHDYWPAGGVWPDVKDFVDRIKWKEIEVKVPFAYCKL